MEEFEDGGRGQGPAERPATAAVPGSGLAAAIAAVALPAVPVFEPGPVVRLPDRAHRTQEHLLAAGQWHTEADDRYQDTVAALVEVARLEARTAALKARLVAALDAASDHLGEGLGLDGWQRTQQATSTTAELACALRVPHGAAAVMELDASRLTGPLTGTLHGLEEGRYSYQHAQIIMDEVDSLSHGGTVPAPVCEAFEARLLAAAPDLTAGRLRAKARHWREKEHPETIEKRHQTACEDRNLSLSPDRDGMSRLQLYLPADTGQGIWNRATATARAAQGPAESRTLTQLRLDIAAAWLLTGTITTTAYSTGGAGKGNRARAIAGNGRRGPDAGNGNGTGAEAGARGTEPAGPDGAGVRLPDCTIDGAGAPRATVLVTIPVFALMGLTDEPAELEGYGPIPPSMARKLAAEAPEFIRLLIHPHTGEPLSIGRDRHRVPRRMRSWLRGRDGKCTFPGCTTVTADTDVDHLKATEHGGSTDEDNLGNTCKRHHLLKHQADGKDRNGRRKEPPQTFSETGVGAEAGAAAASGPREWVRGWTPTMTESGLPSWTAPSGRTYPPAPRDFSPPVLPELFASYPSGTGGAKDARPPWPTLPEDPEAGTWWRHLSYEEPPDPVNEEHDEDDGCPRQHPDVA